MFGAFGKMNETSSNLLRLRQFSARNILLLSGSTESYYITQRFLPASPAVSKSMSDDDGSGVSLERRDD